MNDWMEQWLAKVDLVLSIIEFITVVYIMYSF